MGLLAGLTLLACKEEQQTTEEEACVSDLEFFQEQVYTPILSSDCGNCHNEQGQAKNTSFILRGPEWGPNYLEQNLEMFTQLAKLEYEGTPWILLKPTQGITHEGGQRFQQGSDQYAAFEEMVRRIETPTVCTDTEEDDFFAEVELLDEVATLRKATLSLAGRLPTLDEEQRVRDGGFEAIDGVLEAVMHEEEFFVRLKEIYNDHFLTDRYYGATGKFAIDLIDAEVWPGVNWFNEEWPAPEEGDDPNRELRD
jgi:hypothetical protein